MVNGVSEGVKDTERREVRGLGVGLGRILGTRAGIRRCLRRGKDTRSVPSCGGERTG